MFELVLEGENSQNRHQTDSIFTYISIQRYIFVIYSDLGMYIYISDICVNITHAHTVYPLCFFFNLFHTWSIFQLSLRRDRRIVIRKVTTCVPSACSPTPPPRRSAPKKNWMNLRQKVSHGKYAYYQMGQKL